jgi:hypothetical protein
MANIFEIFRNILDLMFRISLFNKINAGDALKSSAQT